MHVPPPSRRLKPGTALVLVLAWSHAAAGHELRLPAIIGDNMVLQQERPARFWGWAEPGATVALVLQGKRHEAAADEQGRWRIDGAPPRPEPEPIELTFTERTAGGAVRTRVVKNVLVGEVWLCSGQSNMQMALAASADAAEALAAAGRPRLRLFTVNPHPAVDPCDDVKGKWVECDGKSARDFSAVAYHFGTTLEEALHRPIGLVQSVWGGTAAASWISPEGLTRCAATRKRYETAQPEIERARGLAESLREDETGWAATDLATAAWIPIKLPLYFDYALQPGEYDGVVWARKQIEIPADWAGKPLALHLGKVDDFETTYFNGQEVGKTARHTLAAREYVVPAELVRPGTATIAVRVTKVGWGGIFGPAELMRIFPEGRPDAAVSLAGEWLYRPAELRLQHLSPTLLGSLFNGMIGPLAPLGLRGAIWYQGEADAYATTSRTYRDVLGGLIDDWRRQFDNSDLAFGIAQLTSFRPPTDDPNKPSDWAMLRESQLMAACRCGGGLAVTIDAGDATDIHPKNKRVVGQRLAGWALAQVYGRPAAASGPVLREMQVRGNEAVLHFSDVAGGLVGGADGSVDHVAIAGADKKFHWALARIEGDTVVVTSDQVPAPVAVRYGWADNPSRANLFGKNGLPASPFRTDDW
jgi:sialate O-acetylesterase